MSMGYEKEASTLPLYVDMPRIAGLGTQVEQGSLSPL